MTTYFHSLTVHSSHIHVSQPLCVFFCLCFTLCFIPPVKSMGPAILPTLLLLTTLFCHFLNFAARLEAPQSNRGKCTGVPHPNLRLVCKAHRTRPITNANEIDRACHALRRTTSYITPLKTIVWCLLSLICVNEKENLRVNLY